MPWSFEPALPNPSAMSGATQSHARAVRLLYAGVVRRFTRSRDCVALSPAQTTTSSWGLSGSSLTVP